MKVYVLISATAIPGKSKEAREAVFGTVQYLNGNSNYAGRYEALVPANGPNKGIQWLCYYESMADYEKDVELRGKDAAWSKAFAKVDETVDVDNIRAEVFRVRE
jgi:hypothetical protein